MMWDMGDIDRPVSISGEALGDPLRGDVTFLPRIRVPRLRLDQGAAIGGP